MLTLGAASAQAAVRYGPPPPPREVVRIAPGPRYVWTGGYYRWGAPRGYAWVPGRYVVAPRPYAVWVPGYWARRPRGWFWVGGYWR
jgi:hypothetical protein